MSSLVPQVGKVVAEPPPTPLRRRSAGAPLALCAALLLPGCGGSQEPTWAFDPIHLEPEGDGVFGLQTWLIYSDRWHKKRKDRFYLCSVVVGFHGTPTSCDGCEVAWEVEPEVVESDCGGALAERPVFVSLERVGVGEQLSGESLPHLGATSEGLADYGFGWEHHGWAYPEALDVGRSTAADRWDAETPFLLWPTSDWPLE